MRAIETIRERIEEMELGPCPQDGGYTEGAWDGEYMTLKKFLSLLEAEQGCEGCIYERDRTSVPDPACEFCSRRLEDKYSPHPPTEAQG